MEDLKIPGGANTPEIDFSGDNGSFRFSGRSFPENVFDFYGPVLKYIETYSAAPAAKTNVEFNLNYFNTASYKIIVKILLAFSRIDASRSAIVVKWHSDKNDMTIIEKGEELKEYIKLNFEIVQV